MWSDEDVNVYDNQKQDDWRQRTHYILQEQPRDMFLKIEKIFIFSNVKNV